jgi:hypothetical protein
MDVTSALIWTIRAPLSAPGRFVGRRAWRLSFKSDGDIISVRINCKFGETKPPHWLHDPAKQIVSHGGPLTRKGPLETAPLDF